jgi:hypothetical protein
MTNSLTNFSADSWLKKLDILIESLHCCLIINKKKAEPDYIQNSPTENAEVERLRLVNPVCSDEHLVECQKRTVVISIEKSRDN